MATKGGGVSPAPYNFNEGTMHPQTSDYIAEQALIEISRLQREALVKLRQKEKQS